MNWGRRAPCAGGPAPAKGFFQVFTQLGVHVRWRLYLHMHTPHAYLRGVGETTCEAETDNVLRDERG